MGVNKIEVFDIDVLEHLLRHEGVTEMDKKNLRRYKKRRINGNQVQILYDYPERVRDLGKGRIYPEPFLGLAAFPRDIRKALAGKYYDEVDMENSQPRLLVQIAAQEGILCDNLKQYVERRAEVLEAIQKTKKMTRDEAKDVCIAVVFGGYRDEHPLLPKIKEELDTLALKIVAKYPEFVAVAKKSQEYKNFKNINGSTLAQFCQHQETLILLALDAFFTTKGYELDVLQHDGGNVKKKDGESMPPTLLREAEETVFENLGFKINLALKSLECPFDFTPSTDTVVPKDILINDSFAAKKFIALAGDRLRKVGTELYIQNADGIWETGDDKLRNLIKEFELQLIWKQWNKDDSFLRVFDYGGTVQNISKLIVQTHAWANPGSLPLQFAYQQIQKPSSTQEPLELFLLLVSLVSGKDERLADYVLKWIAHILQRPTSLPGVMLVLSGQKGVGKDTLFDFLIEHVFGERLGFNYEDNKQFFDHHDCNRKGKLLVKLTEADRKYCLPNASYVKAMVTSPTMTFNPKCEKAFTVPNYTRYVFTTNKGNPVDFGGGERRFVILPCSSEKKNQQEEFWTPLRQKLFTPEAGKLVADFLLKVDLSEFEVKKFPVADYQADVVDSEKSAEEKFVDEWDGEKLSAFDLYQKYVDYCQREALTYHTNANNFYKALLPFLRDNVIQKRRIASGVIYEKSV